MVSKRIKISISIFAFIMISFLMLSIPESYETEKCDKINNIADNQMSIRYMYEWANMHIYNEEFIKRFSRYKYIYANESPMLFKQIDFQWDSVGINPEFGILRIENIADGNSAKAVGFGEGRNWIILRISRDSKYQVEVYCNRKKVR